MARSRIVNLANFPSFQAVNLLSDPGHIGGKFTIPNGIIVNLVWTLASGKTGHNVLWGEAGGSFNPTVAVADSMLTALTAGTNWTGLAGFLSTSTALAAVRLRDMRQIDMPFVSSVGAAHAGTDAALAMPNEMAAVISLGTALVGPANRGRIYVPGFGSDAVAAGNVIAPLVVNALNQWCVNIVNAFTAASLVQSIGHPPRNAYTGTGGAQHPQRQAGLVHVTTLQLRDNHWDSQRRRGLK